MDMAMDVVGVGGEVMAMVTDMGMAGDGEDGGGGGVNKKLKKDGEN